MKKILRYIKKVFFEKEKPLHPMKNVAIDGAPAKELIVSFKPAVQDHFYIGDPYLGMDLPKELETGDFYERVISAPKESFLPDVINDIKGIIGDKHIFIGSAICSMEYDLHFYVKEKNMEAICNEIIAWADYNDVKHLLRNPK